MYYSFHRDSGGVPAPRSFFRHVLPSISVLLSFFFVFTLWAHASDETEGVYLAQLIERAAQGKLADDREWHLLLHYQPDFMGGYTSEADDPSFFLSPSGRTNPVSELNAAIRSFFSTVSVSHATQPVQCAFIARYHWLKVHLSIEERAIPVVHCERFEQWVNEMNAASVTLVFASAFLENPASVFGHTFLRLDPKGQTEQTRLLAYTINYAAEVPPTMGLFYPIKGLFGGFKGRFMAPPYYVKVQEYRDIENRDIWEYRLRFSEAQVRRLLEHAWELGNTYFDYFFLKENCSYHILSLLEWADPSLQLRNHFYAWTVPADTVRLIASYQGLIQEVVFRPSRRTQIRRKQAWLLPEERDLAQGIFHDISRLSTPEVAKLPTDRRALVLDVAAEYLRYNIDANREVQQQDKETYRTVLAARSALAMASDARVIAPFATNPDLGHRASRASVGSGWRNNDMFQDVTLRGGYHDLLDPEIGYTPDTQIEVASVSVRHYNRGDQTRVERATLVNVLSLSPMDSFFHVPSWKMNVGLQTIRHRGCQLCSNGVANVGVGTAVETQFFTREVYFAFADGEANYSPAYEQRHRIGGGGTAGMLVDLTARWKLMATGTYLKYALGETSDDIRWYVGSRYTLSRNWALRLEYHHRDHDNDLGLSLQSFF